jgi:cell division protein FtsQ
MKTFVKILLITLWIALAVGAAALLYFSKTENDNKICKNISCSINYNNHPQLISGEDVLKSLTTKFGDFNQKKISEIDLLKIANLIKSNPYFSKTDVVLSVEGILQVSVTQCNPILRIIDNTGKQFYISEEGRIMPINQKYPVKSLLVTSGTSNILSYGKNIYSIADSNKNERDLISNLYSAHHLGKIIITDTILNSLIEQIDINPAGKIQLVTKAGSHIIQFGDTTLSSEKLDNLKHFYKNALTKTGWTKYSVLNLEYKNQVVCRK